MLKICATCNIEKPIDDFPCGRKVSGGLYYRPHCYSCKYNKEKQNGRVPDKAYFKSYYYKHKLYFKYKAYRHNDKVKFNNCETIEKYKAIELMMLNCSYCGRENSNGLDRLDNTLGHIDNNVVPCCEKCNYILGDLPVEAKELLKEGLTSIREKGLLEKWQIPTKRTKE